MYLTCIQLLKLIFSAVAAGFEYCVESRGFGPVEKTYHLSRRRRWIRQRTMVAESNAIKEKVGFGTAIIETDSSNCVRSTSE